MSSGRPFCSCAARHRDGPLPLLFRAIWRASTGLVPCLASFLGATRTRLVARRNRGAVSVVVLLSNPPRAAAMERSLRAGIVRVLAVLDLVLSTPLVVLVAETADPAGQEPSVLEREVAADGITRYLLRLAFVAPGRTLPVSVDALLAELVRQLLTIQRLEVGVTVTSIRDELGSGAPFNRPGAAGPMAACPRDGRWA